MRRTVLPLCLVVPLLLSAAGCGDDEPAPPPPAASAPASVPASPTAAEPAEPDSSSDFVEEEPDPTAAPGDLSDEAQALLDEALGVELGALEEAPAAEADKRRPVLDQLPETPQEVLAALTGYDWFSAEAEGLYQRAVRAG